MSFSFEKDNYAEQRDTAEASRAKVPYLCNKVKRLPAGAKVADELGKVGESTEPPAWLWCAQYFQSEGTRRSEGKYL